MTKAWSREAQNVRRRAANQATSQPAQELFALQQSRRELLSATVGGSLVLCAPAAFAQSDSPAANDVGFVDPELRPLARSMLKAIETASPLSLAQLPALRTDNGGPPPLSAPPFARHIVPGTAGAPDLVVFVINAREGTRRPAILHLHGGGFILGSARDSVPRLQTLAATLDCVIVTVEYRLAPETAFDGILADIWTGLLWLSRNVDALGADPQRIAVMGESAGGGLAALLALMARDRGGPPLVFQMLIYPLLDDRTGTTVQPSKPIGLLGWTAEYNRVGWGAFLGMTPGGSRVPWRAVPARHVNLAGLPPAFIGVGAVDLLVDEDITYSRRLIDAHVPTELLVVPGVFHAFDVAAPMSRVAQRFGQVKVEALRRAFASA